MCRMKVNNAFLSGRGNSILKFICFLTFRITKRSVVKKKLFIICLRNKTLGIILNCPIFFAFQSFSICLSFSRLSSFISIFKIAFLSGQLFAFCFFSLRLKREEELTLKLRNKTEEKNVPTKNAIFLSSPLTQFIYFHFLLFVFAFC